MRHTLTRTQPYTPDQLFQLVADIDRYPQFVPWLTSLRSWGRQVHPDGVVTQNAEATVGFAFLTERFSTTTRADPNARTIEVGLISGPFRKLRNEWRFNPVEGGTEVHFMIDFEFKSRLLDQLLRANFHRAVDKLIGCFDDRARQLYGRGQGPSEAGPAAFPAP